MTTRTCEDFGVTEIARAICIACGKQDCKVAVVGVASKVTLCSDCLVDLANLVFESKEPA